MQQISYSTGGFESLDKIGFLWEKLMLHHRDVGLHPAIKQSTMTFERRKQELSGKEIRVDMATLCDGTPVGYCISSVDVDKAGEIESLYVEPVFQKNGIGGHLMGSAIEWLDSKHVVSKLISVVSGNESAHGFYERFGFYSRCILMMQK